MLTRLSFSQRPDPTPGAWRALYGAWCLRVPFDNVQKLVHLQNDTPAPLLGTEAEDFLEAWLQHGTGGTCWAGSTALLDRLTALGFEAERGIATMLVAPGLPPNHGTVRVQIANQHYLVDSSILFGEPLLLNEAGETRIPHPAWFQDSGRGRLVIFLVENSHPGPMEAAHFFPGISGFGNGLPPCSMKAFSTCASRKLPT